MAGAWPRRVLAVNVAGAAVFVVGFGLAGAPSARADPPLLLRPPAVPEAPPPGYVLRTTANGGYTYQEEGWRVAIAPDGTVEFSDRTVVLQSLRIGPLNLFSKTGLPGDRPSLQSALRDALRPHPPPDTWEEAREPIWKYHADPRADCRPRDPCYFVPIAGPIAAGGLMDLTDAYMRWMKQDPYRPAKARFLAATFELRIKMATRRHKELLRQSLEDLPARLQALWRDPARPPVEKRQLLFLLWNEASEGEQRPDGETRRAVRATIERFIRATLPRDAPDGFTDAELARYREESSGAFESYVDVAPGSK